MKRRILVIDDELHMLELLEHVLTEYTEHTVVTTNNSLEINSILEKEQFDIIVTDLKMPGCDGLDVLNWIKDHDRPEEVIIMTAFGSAETTDKARELGAFDYVKKPFRKEQILLSISRAERLLDARHSLQKLESILFSSDLGEAESRFREEYWKRLVQECDGNVEEIADISGRPADEVATMVAKYHQKSE